jgi:hypothetical protein
VKPTDARRAYNELAKYFGLRARDAFLNAADGKSDGGAGPGDKNPKSEFLNAIFSQSTSGFADNAKLSDLAKNLVSDDFCAITQDGTKFDKIDYKKKSDQGWGVGTGNVKISDFAAINDEGNVMALQIFPINVGLDITDTEITSLFLNSLNTLSISQAVPYMDVQLITAVPEGDGNFKSAPKMSLGKFLGAGDESNDAMLGRFTQNPAVKGANDATLGTVAGMEIFTTPQTLVDSTNVSYSREKGGPIDKFRPFMAIEGITITDSFSGAGTISYKSAEMNLILFDKGRLNEISEFVAPRRDPNVKFQITYGWSHPDGGNLSRPADSDAEARIGTLVDSMRVSELYTLVNSNYNINADGTVNIGLTLSMDATNQIMSKTLMGTAFSISSTQGINVNDLNRQLEDIKNTFADVVFPGNARIDLPTFVQSPDIGSIISMDSESVKKLRQFANRLRQSKKLPASVRSEAATLMAIFGKRGTRKTLVKGREDQATGFVNFLRKTADPYLRFGSSKYGVQEAHFKGGRIKKREDEAGEAKKQTYVSYGKLMLSVLTPVLSGPDTDLQFFFSSFNANAAAVFDYNIAQFPIELNDFEKELKEFLKKRAQVTIDDFVRFVSEKFLTFDGARAFGMSNVVKPNERKEVGSTQSVASKATRRLFSSKDPADALKLQKIQRDNLLAIYGQKRKRPLYVKPRVSMRIVTRKSSSDPSKSVTRVYFQDLTAGQQTTTAQALIDLMRSGVTDEPDYSSTVKDKKRTPRHNEAFSGNLKKLVDLKYIVKASDQNTNDDEKVKDAIKKSLEDKLKGNDKDARIKEILDSLDQKYFLNTDAPSLRKFFFENSPYLLHGTEASGIIEASMSAEADDNLTSIFLAQRYSGKGDLSAPQQSTNLPFMVHPATLSITTFGCPTLNLAQKYFVDYATNTTLDNYYNVVSVSHKIDATGYTTSAELKPANAYGSYANIEDRLADILILAYKSEKKKAKK